MTPSLELKDSSVKWEVVPEIEAAQDTIAKVYSDAKAKAVITSAHDGKHSINSGHHQNDPAALSNAIDLRINNLYPDHKMITKYWYTLVGSFAASLVRALNVFAQEKGFNGSFCVVVEKDHIHCEYYSKEKSPNIIGFVSGVTVYKSKDVREAMA